MAQRFLDREGGLIILLGLLVLVFLAAAGYVLWNPPDRAPGPPGAADSTLADSSAAHAAASRGPREVVLAGQDGRTVLELLEAEHRVVLDSELLLFGSIVLAIDDVRAEPDEFWLYYRDSVPGDRPPETCTTANGETIRWVLHARR